jgi:hypothetical protein
MKLEQQVCSLELANKLMELGVNQESWFVWGQGISKRIGIFERRRCFLPKQISAFTVAELGEILPGITKDGMYFTYQWGFMHNRAYAWIKRSSDKGVVAEFEEKTEADARAKILIHLLENHLITA